MYASPPPLITGHFITVLVLALHLRCPRTGIVSSKVARRHFTCCARGYFEYPPPMSQIRAFHPPPLDESQAVAKSNTNRSFWTTASPHLTGFTFLFNDIYIGTFKEIRCRYVLRKISNVLFSKRFKDTAT